MFEKFKFSKRMNCWILYYAAALISVVLFVLGFLLMGSPSDRWAKTDLFTYLTLGIPFCLWTWLLLIGLIFFKKSNEAVKTICVFTAIPQAIFIALLIGHQYSFFEVIKWYAMIFSFGLIRGL